MKLIAHLIRKIANYFDPPRIRQKPSVILAPRANVQQALEQSFLSRIDPAVVDKGDRDFLLRLIATVKPYRDARALSKLAKAINRTESTLRSWNGGCSKPNVSDIRNLCEVTCTDVRWLVAGGGTQQIKQFPFVIKPVDAAASDAGDAAFVLRLNSLVQPYRDFRALTELSKAINRTEGASRSWLRGESKPNVSDVRLLCEVTGASIEWLVTGKGSMRGGA